MSNSLFLPSPCITFLQVAAKFRPQDYIYYDHLSMAILAISESFTYIGTIVSATVWDQYALPSHRRAFDALQDVIFTSRFQHFALEGLGNP